MQYLKIGDFCNVSSSKRVFASQYVNYGIPFYRQKEIIDKKNGEDIKEPIYISKSLYNELKSKSGVPNPGDLLITAVGATLGIPYVVKDEKFYFKDGNLIRLSDFENMINSTYLYYWMNSTFGFQTLWNRTIGSAQPALTIDSIKKLSIPIPSRETQDSIVFILTTFDNLITNNNKSVKLLEQMIESLYKEWFVRFRFPEFKNTEFTNGIPYGWSYITLDKIVSFDRGISYSSEEIECDDGVNLINLKNIQSYGGFRREGTKKYNGKFKESQVVKKGDLILGVTDMTQDRRTVGHVAMIPTMEDVCVISADLVKINSKISKVFLYSMFRYGFYSKYFSQFANGANVLHLKPSVLMNKKILMPSKELIDEFSKKVSPMMEMIDKLNLMNGNLIKQRDYLLPRLMSGKLEV